MRLSVNVCQLGDCIGYLDKPNTNRDDKLDAGMEEVSR